VKFRRASFIATTLLLLLFLRDQTQAQPGSDTSLPPHAAPSQAQPGEVLWYGKAPPGLDEGVGPMKLVAPGVGWAQRGRRLYWTSDNCTSWKDITPPIDIGAVFFLDTQKGWAAADNGGRSPSSDDLPLEVASTTDAGANWSVTHVSLSLKDYDLPHNDVSHYETEPISFADTSHGWMDVRVDGQTMNLQWNFLLVTSNGGRTWRPAPSVPYLVDADVLLVTPTEGWMIGGEGGATDKLYFTLDGAKSWKEVSLAAPNEILPADQPAYDLPVFEGTKRGFVAVTYTGDGVNSAAVLFATEDGGRTWRPDRIVKKLGSDSPGQTLQSAMAGSAWVTAIASDGLMLSTLGPRARVNAARADWRSFRPLQLSMISPTHGWLLTSNGKLLSTTNGGATWTTITPGPQPNIIDPVNAPAR
jgi:photosystem II stability/assembly factor-like uncharacterized protein